MSGETEAQVSPWTTDTLKQHLDGRIDDLKDRLQERYETQVKAVDAALQAQQTAMQAAFAAAEKAVEQRATTLDREFHEHLEQVRHENALAFLNSDKAVQAALTSQQTAVNKAEQASEKRFESVNEFRAQLNDQARNFMTRAEYTVAHEALEKTVDDLKDRINLFEGHSQGSSTTWGVVLAIVVPLLAIATTIIIATR